MAEYKNQSRNCLLLPISTARSEPRRSFVSLPPDEKYWPRSCEEPGKCHSATFSFWHMSEAEQWVWIKRLDMEERAITQDEGLRGYAGAICAQPFFSGYTVSGSRLETHRSSSDRQKRRLTHVSSRSGTGQIRPPGVERPSNITQPFDLSTPTRPLPAVMDGFLCEPHDL